MLRRIRIPALLFLLLAAVAISAAVYVLTFHPPREHYPVRGIDVSHHQGRIDWAAVAADGIQFAYIKATEGGDFSDPRFTENWRHAKDAGVVRGAYHFFTLCRPGKEQAAHFIKSVPKDKTMMPPAVDLEFTGNCTDKNRWLDVPVELAAFLELVEAHYGRKAVLYVRPEFYAAHLKDVRVSNPLWLQGIVFEPTYGRRPWTFWQYHTFSRVKGIEGLVDRNVFRGTETDFAEWVGNGALNP